MLLKYPGIDYKGLTEWLLSPEGGIQEDVDYLWILDSLLNIKIDKDGMESTIQQLVDRGLHKQELSELDFAQRDIEKVIPEEFEEGETLL